MEDAPCGPAEPAVQPAASRQCQCNINKDYFNVDRNIKAVCASPDPGVNRGPSSSRLSSSASSNFFFFFLGSRGLRSRDNSSGWRISEVEYTEMESKCFSMWYKNKEAKQNSTKGSQVLILQSSVNLSHAVARFDTLFLSDNAG